MMTWRSVMTTFVIGLLSVLATVVITIIKNKTVKWSRRISDPIIERLNEQLDKWIDDSINTVNKNFVDKQKETGEWDRLNGVFCKEIYKKNAAEALERCLSSLKSRIPKGFKRLVAKYYDDTDLFYKNRIDERLKEHEVARRSACEKQAAADKEKTAVFGIHGYAPYRPHGDNVY